MVKCSIFTSKEEVFKALQVFLSERKFKKVNIDKAQKLINAQRRDSVFSKKYAVRFEVIAKSDSVSDIEITVNPQNAIPNPSDTKLEEKIRSRLYFYF